MFDYEIKFYSNGTLLTTNSDDRLNHLEFEFNRLSNLTIKEVEKELGVNDDLEFILTHIKLVNYKTGEIKEYVFDDESYCIYKL